MKAGQASRRGAAAQKRRTTMIATAGVLLVAVVIGTFTLIGQQHKVQATAAAIPSDASVASSLQVTLPSTSGADLQLAQMRGAPLVVYFYEGST